MPLARLFTDHPPVCLEQLDPKKGYINDPKLHLFTDLSPVCLEQLDPKKSYINDPNCIYLRISHPSAWSSSIQKKVT